MKKLYTLMVIAIATVGFTTSANAQSTATAAVSTTLITPISIIKDADMNFGTIAATAADGTVVLDWSDKVTKTGGANIISETGVKTAQFTVTGETANSFIIQIPSTVILTNAGGETLTVSSIEAESGTERALVAGTNVIKIKGTLTVPGNTVAGDYNNSNFVVTASYN